ncbi:MAG: hypothetical protein JXA24_04265 [Proteobacteria bacterium]|nr:hypothetical protein [Pseudomonadota bacterium]
MRFFILMALYGVAAVVLATTVLAGWPTQMIRFDLIIPAVAVTSFYKGRGEAIPVVLFYGLIVDAASAAPFGMSVLSYVVVYLFVRAIITKISLQEGVGLLFWVAIISLVDKAVCAVVLYVSSDGIYLSRIVMELAPAQALMDAAVGFVVIPIITWYWDLSWEKISRPRGLVLK